MRAGGEGEGGAGVGEEGEEGGIYWGRSEGAGAV